MGLRDSIINSQRIIGGNGVGNSGCNMRFNLNRISPSIAIQRAIQKPSESAPSGYRMPKKAALYPIANGGIAGKATNAFDVSSSIIGDGYMTLNETITFTVSGSGDLLASISGSENITFIALCDILGYGYLNGNADISAQPTAADIAGEFFATFIDGTFTMKDVLKVLVAVAAGKTNIVDLGGGSATVEFRDLSDTKNTVVADMINSERTDLTFDL